MSLSITQSGIGGPLHRFQWMTRAVAWADEVGPITRTLLKGQAPVGKGPRAGRMRGAIRYSRTTTPTMVRLEFKAHTPYAGYTITGTRPHTITAVAARMLHWKEGGRDFFRKSVHHPGTHPNPWHHRAMRVAEPIAMAAYRRIMEGL